MNNVSKYKGFALLAGLTVVVPVAVLSLALSGTVAKYKLRRQIQNEIFGLQNTPISPMETTKVADSEPGEDVVHSGKIIQLLSRPLSAHKITLDKYTPYTISQTEGIRVSMAELQLRGSYVSLVQLIEHIEKRDAGCRISSVSFRGIKNRRSGETSLTCHIILQQITIENTHT